MPDQYSMQDPTKMYATRTPDEQYLPGAGTDEQLAQNVPADHGEDAIGARGSGRLQDRKALITGGDEGIAAAVAIAYASEGADVAIVYLPEDEEDAQRIVGLIEGAGREAVAIAGDLERRSLCPRGGAAGRSGAQWARHPGQQRGQAAARRSHR